MQDCSTLLLYASTLTFQMCINAQYLLDIPMAVIAEDYEKQPLFKENWFKVRQKRLDILHKQS